ncbi:penicillin acylase family protein [Sediminibacterium sp. KACHI17]|uniref:penicillin acylase family protein n=1 Tax=Sediminibacterium sp. KACHI17 TaxID=1751071 RepID=UPI00336599B7
MKKSILLLSFSLLVLSLSAQFNINKIEIVRDSFGVPHIFAPTDAEVAYGLAWAHAEDDFYTIQQSYMAGKALLGAYKGKEGATIDYIVHLMRIKELVAAKYESDISPAYKRLLEGYAAGFNAYAKAHPKEVLLKKLFPITPKDMLQYSVLQLCVLSGADGALKSIFGNTVPVLDDMKPGGSNAFAFNSRKTTDGQTYLAINSHQPLEGPVSWYEAHLQSEEGWNIIGANFPGAPTILSGVNEYLGWAHTVNEPDKLDVYQLSINPNNKLQYLFDGQWETLEEKTANLKVKVSAIRIGVKRKVYWSKYGPTVITERGTFSIRMPAQMDIRGLEEWYWLNKAKNFTEFKKALNMMAIPGYNIVYADRYDTIYYLSNGRIPVRDKMYNWRGTLPGNTSKTLWTEIHPLENLPQVLQPSSGFVYNTNHSPFHATEGPDNFKLSDLTMGYETLENNRSMRFAELIKQYDKVSYEDFKRIKYDGRYPEKFSFAIDIDSLFMLNASQYPALADLIHQLKQWDRNSDIQNTGATIFAHINYQIYALARQGKRPAILTTPICISLLENTRKDLMQYFGKTNVPLGDYQKHVRGDKSIPLPGLPDVLTAMYSVTWKNGMVKGNQGESYIELVRFTKDGPIIESINTYGASAKKGSPHYTDQMEMFAAQKTKKMSLKKEDAYKNAIRVYHPSK